MKQVVARYAGWMLLSLTVSAEPMLIAPQQNLIAPQQSQAFAGSSLSNLRVLRQSADGSEAILTIDFTYDGLRGPSARLLPIITDKKKSNISGWFGADPVTISAGHGTVSLKIKFFNDDPGVPSEVTTDHVRVMMLTDGGNIFISEGIFYRTIKWGSANAPSISVPELKPEDQARLKAEQEQRIALEQAKAEADARAARLKAEADAQAAEQIHQAALAKQLADEKAKAQAEAKAHEEAEAKRLVKEKAKAEAEAKQLADEKAKSETEAKAREEARLKLEAEEKAHQEAEAKQLAEEKAKAEAEANRLAEAKTREEAAKQLAQEKAAAASSARKPTFAISSTAKTKVTNIDVVNRNLDRTEMTIAVEYHYSKDDGAVRMGVDVASTDNPGISDYFSSVAANIGKGSRNFVMFPVKLDSAAAQSLNRRTLPTDKIWIYVINAAGEKFYIFQGTMMLVWHIPGGGEASSANLAQGSHNTLEIESFKQNDLFSGYVTVKYNLRSSEGHLHLSVYDSANPATAQWFESDDIPIKSGPGLQLVRIDVPRRAHSPDVFNVDTVEIQMRDAHGTLLASSRNQSPMSWAKPK
ncbi:MAG TPA: hypothetical protein VH595_12790 [Verrucomicrobiae bacterium]|nr:hypothetical protein [Verrucomicrobiae bacterium]